MKFTVLLLALASFVSLTSCNTSIGIWRDTKEGYRWTKNKIQESRSDSGGGGNYNYGGGGGDSSYDGEYGAPIY
ncbi:MAG: hypothetical protein QM627_12980 [Luteolibacter sp.]